MNDKLIELLLRSFDNSLTSEEHRQLAEALATSQWLREEQKRLVAMRNAVSASATRSFKPRFAERVMQRIVSLREKAKIQEEFFESLLWVFRRVAVSGAVALLILISYNLSNSDSISLERAFAVPQITLETALESTFALNLESL